MSSCDGSLFNNKRFHKISIAINSTLYSKEKYSIISFESRVILLITIIIFIPFINLLKNNIIIKNQNKISISLNNKKNILTYNKTNKLTNNRKNFLKYNKIIDKGFLFLKGKIDDTNLINLERYIKNEKIYDINEFYYNKTIKFDNMFNNVEKDEVLYIKKFVDLSRHLFLLTSIPKETFNSPFISICSPVYNVAKHLPSLIRSFQNQNFKNYELILVDDGSSDKSGKIIKLFQKFDKRIKYIKNQFNRGTAYSRALGLENARGKYITFFDPDDLAANFYIIESTYKIYKEFGVDYIKTDIIKEENSRIKLTSNHYFSPSNTVIFEDEYRHSIFESDDKKFFGGVHYEVIKRTLCKRAYENIKDIYKKSKSKFIVYEDFALNKAFINEVNSLYFLPLFTYFYEKERIKDRIRIPNVKGNMYKINFLYYHQIELRLVKTNKELKPIYKSFKSYYINGLFNQISECYKEDFISFCKELINKYNLFQRLNNETIYFDEINTLNKKLNLVLKKNNTLC